MAGLGGTSLGSDKEAIGMFLSTNNGKNKEAKEVKETETYNIQKGVRLSERQNANLEDLKVALGSSNEAEVLRWAFDKLFELMGSEIKEMAEKKRSMSLS
jgi:hypothetical protein